MAPTFSALLLLFLLSPLTVLAQRSRDPVPNVPWAQQARFRYRRDVSDEFNARYLDENKWDLHGTRNPETGCPLWNGPLSTVDNDLYSTYYTTSTNPRNPRGPKVREYRMRDGMIWLRIAVHPERYFASRQYYCNPKTFRCNHDSRIKCHWTDAHGQAILNEDGSYAGVTHDKCKKEPFCLPHHRYVLDQPKMPYRKYASAHITGKKLFRYGYIETRVKVASSSAVLAVWMHGQDSTGDGYCRFKLITVDSKSKGKGKQNNSKPKTRIVRECPSRVNSDRWMEIDIVEAMNSQFHKRLYVPNAHVFQCSKGEFSSRHASEDPNGGMGGGPIVINTFIDNEALFGHVPKERRVPNSFHMNSGSLHTLDKDWAAKERTVGVYWSAKELRFYVDGVEIRSIENTLIHQAMALDVSMSLNPAWAKEMPKDRAVQQWGGVDYVRVWDVFTNGGKDPPRTTKLGTVMRRKFVPKYGYDLKGVFDVFPQNDDRTMVLVDGTWQRERKKSSSKTKQKWAARVSSLGANMTATVEGERLPEWEGEGEMDMAKPFIRAKVFGEEQYHGKGLFFASKQYVDALKEPAESTGFAARMAAHHGVEEDSMEMVTVPGDTSVREGRLADRGNDSLYFAGGVPAIRGLRARKQWSAAERRGQLSRPDRAARVKRMHGKVLYEFITNPAQTVFDFFDPIKPGAAFATADGSGRGM